MYCGALSTTKIIELPAPVVALVMRISMSTAVGREANPPGTQADAKKLLFMLQKYWMSV